MDYSLFNSQKKISVLYHQFMEIFQKYIFALSYLR